jgi:hypothetical protein
MAKAPPPTLDPKLLSHAPEPSLQPWMFAKRELVVVPTMHRTTALHAGLVLAIGTLVLAMLASEPLVGWANRLPAHPIAERVIVGAQAWNEAMSAIGMTDVFAGLKDFFARLRSL